MYTHIYQSQENSEDSNLVYGLSVIDYPAKHIPSDSESLKGFFDGVVKGGLANNNGKLISEKSIIFDNYPGKEFKINDSSGPSIVTIQMILVKERVFSLHTVSLPGRENNTTATKFYNSFNIK